MVGIGQNQFLGNNYLSQLGGPLGSDPELLQRIYGAQSPEQLRTALDAFTTKYPGPMPGQAIPPYLLTTSPGQAFLMNGPICGGGYAQGPRDVDFGQQGRQFEHILATDPGARQRFEQAIGGRIVSFGGALGDGKMQIEPFPPNFACSSNPMVNAAGAPLYGMQNNVNNYMAQTPYAGVPQSAAYAGLGLGALGGGVAGLAAGSMMGSPFSGLLLGGLGGALMGSASMSMAGFGAFPGAPVGGVGFGSWNPLAMPGRMQNTNPIYEAAHQAQCLSVMNDPSLSVEDKVVMMLMLIMKKQDRDIESQLNYINALQNQQGKTNKKGGKKGKAGMAGGAMLGGPKGAMIGGQMGSKMGGSSGSSIDVETQKLNRMVTKRSQMFEMLKAIIDKYNETAKSQIQSIGR